jgi:mRNA deadenylase 3'-5' endonuclease subunit Ccr4
MLEYAPESRISASEALCKLNQVDMPVSDTSQHERLASIVDELFAEIEDGKMSIEDIMSNVRVREITDDVEFLFQSVTQFGTDSIVTNDRLYIRKSPIRNVLMLAMDDLFSAKYFKNKILLQLSKKNNGWILLVDLYNVDRFQRIFKSFGHIDINQFTDVVSNCTLIQVSDDGSQIKKLETKNIALEIASRIDHYFSEYVYAFMRIIHERERKSGVGISLDDMFKFPRFGDINVNSVPREEIITAIQSKCTFVRLVQHEGTNYIKRIRPYTMRETRTANNLDFHFGQRYERNAFSVMSYNVLAEYLAQDEMYDYVNSKVKKWSKRRNFICSQIQYYRPAIVCLQEVQSNSTGTENHYSEILTKLEDAYVGTYKRKTSTKNVDTGVATFIRNDSELIVLKTFTIEFGKLLLKHCTGYSSNLFRQGFSQVAQIHHLVHKGNGDQLLLCNVHLCNGGSTAHIQLHQVQILLNQIQEYMTKNSIQKVIICGDFNSTPSSLVYELLSTGTLCNESLKLLETLCCNFSMKQKVWGHTFNLHSTYSSVLGQEPDFTVYTSETHICIDYIWHFNFNTLAVLDIPKEDDISKEIALPNRKHPSDHIPLLVLLK